MDLTSRMAARRAATGGEEERVASLVQRFRAGEIDRRAVEFCARAGDEVCQMLVEVEIADLYSLIAGCRDESLLPRLTRWAHDCVRRLVLPMGAEADPKAAVQLFRHTEEPRFADLALVLTDALLKHGPTGPLIEVVTAYSRRVRHTTRGHMLEAADFVLRAACIAPSHPGMPHRRLSAHRRFVFLAEAITTAYQAQGSKRSERAWQIAHLSRVLLG